MGGPTDYSTYRKVWAIKKENDWVLEESKWLGMALEELGGGVEWT